MQIVHLRMVKTDEIYLSKFFYIYVGDNYFELQNIYIYMCVSRYRLRDLKSVFSLNWSIVALQCCVSFSYTTKWISYIYTHITSVFGFPSHLGYHRSLSPVLYSRLSLVICIIHKSVYMPIPICPTPAFPFGSIHLFSVSLFLLCR